jgi:hypothetical protein
MSAWLYRSKSPQDGPWTFKRVSWLQRRPLMSCDDSADHRCQIATTEERHLMNLDCVADPTSGSSSQGTTLKGASNFLSFLSYWPWISCLWYQCSSLGKEVSKQRDRFRSHDQWELDSGRKTRLRYLLVSESPRFVRGDHEAWQGRVPCRVTLD